MQLRSGTLVSFALLFAVTACGGQGMVNTEKSTSTLMEDLPRDPRNAQVGRWGRLFDWPIIPVHMGLTPDGKIFSYGTNQNGDQGAQFNYGIWMPTPDLNAHQLLPNEVGVDIFCGALGLIPGSGDMLVPGGDTRIPANLGIKDTMILGSQSQELNRTQNLTLARWYPTLTTLPNGENLIFGGTDGGGQPVTAAEAYANGQWRTLWGTANGAIINGGEAKWWYPRNFVTPNGRVFGVTGDVMYFLDWEGNGGTQLAGRIPSKSRSYTSTAVMYQPGKILQVGGSTNGDTQARGSNQAITIDVSSGWPNVQNVPDMNYARVWGNATVLPNGEVFISGGTAFENKIIEPGLMAEMWNPGTRQFRTLAAASTARMYHSNTILLPDGTVLTGGGGAPGPLLNKNAEIYYPPYLFNASGDLAPRPTIGAFDKNQTYDKAVTVPFSNADTISRVTLVRTGAATHSFDSSQRFLDLDFTADGGSVNVRMPNSPNIAPPGFYMLFLINQDGVPSVSRIISLGAAPKNPILNPDIVPALNTPFPIVNTVSGKCLDLENGSSANGAKFRQWTCNANSPAQTFKVVTATNGSYKILHAASNKCLDVMDGNAATGTGVHLWECLDVPNQKVRFEGPLHGGLLARFEHSKKCLDLNNASLTDGEKIQQWDCNGTGAQAWKFGDASTTDPASPPAGVSFRLMNAASGKCMDLADANPANGTRIQQWACDAGSPNQRFQIQPAVNGTYSIVHAATGKCVDVIDASADTGAALHSWDCVGVPNQQVRFATSVDGGLQATFEHSGKCLDLNGGSPADAAKIQQWDCNGSAAQSWKLVR